jgi:uncharacterized protein YggE
MQKRIVKNAMAALLLGLACTSFYSVAAHADKPVPQVSSSATGSVEAMPDIAIMKGQVLVEGASPEQAVTEARQSLDSVIRYVKAQGIASEDLDAAQVLVRPVWSYPKDKPRELTGYQAYADFSATVRDVKKLSTLYGGLVKAGATELSPTRFDFSLREDLELQAITNAVALAKKKAEAALKPLNQEVGEVLSLNVDTHWQQPVYKVASMAMRADSAPEPEVNVGNQTIQASVSVTFKLK